jgi:regulatory associated protein of mTOR
MQLQNFTQYIPLSIYDLQTWIGSPSIYVFDSSAAGLIVNWFNKFLEQREKERLATAGASGTTTTTNQRDCILLASCGANEVLPMNPEYPADIFTSCLTTPIKMALRWFCGHTILNGFNEEMIDKIPGTNSF